MTTSSDRHDRSTYLVHVDSPAMEAAAGRLAEYHRARLAWWEDEMRDAETQLRERGINIEEYMQTGGARLEARLDVGLAKRLSEAQAKVAEHRASRDEYVNWTAFFGYEQSARWPVSAVDFRYFDLGGTLNAASASPDATTRA